MLQRNVKIKLKTVLLLLAGAFFIALCLFRPVSAATKTSVKILSVGKSYTIKNTSKVTSSKSAVATAKKKSSTKYTVKGVKKGASTLKVYNKKGKLTQKVYLLVYNGKTFKYDTKALNLAKGKTKIVAASTNKSGVKIKYKSSDTSVATVNSNGKISAKKAGKATIKALFYYKNTKVKTLKKTVNVYSSSYNTDSITLTEGKTKTVSASVSTNCSVKYSSSDTKVAKVNSSGKITAVKKGTATITCKVYIGSTNVKTYNKKVTVNAASTSSASSSSSSSSSSTSANGSASSSSSNTSTGSTSSSSPGSSGDNDTSASGSTGYSYTTSRSSVSISGGRGTSVDVYTDDPTAVIDFKINGDNIVFVDIEEGYLYDGRRYVSLGFTARVAGTCEIKIYINGSLFKTVPVTVTSTDTYYFEYEQWRDDLEKELWTSGMSCYDKILTLGNYVFAKYPYNSSYDTAYGYMWEYGGDCWASSQLLVDVAHDLGLEAETYFANGSTYGHRMAKIYLDDGRVWICGNSASGNGSYGNVYGHME